MRPWSSRVSPEAGLTFVADTAQEIHVLFPPASGQTAEPMATGDGLWIHARWSRAIEDPLVDHDVPSSALRVRTVVVLTLVGPALEDDVRAVMKGQMEMAWRLTAPGPDEVFEQKRTLGHAGLLMRLAQESEEAFPNEAFWRPPAPRGLGVAPDDAGYLWRDGTCSREVALQPLPSVRTLLHALVKALAQKLLRDPRFHASEVPSAEPLRTATPAESLATSEPR